jgi:hypothetical protein
MRCILKSKLYSRGSQRSGYTTREGDPIGWSTVLIIALGSWERPVPRGQPVPHGTPQGLFANRVHYKGCSQVRRVAMFTVKVNGDIVLGPRQSALATA